MRWSESRSHRLIAAKLRKACLTAWLGFAFLQATSVGARGELTLYDDLSAWQAAAGPSAVEDFEAVPLQELPVGTFFEFSETRVGAISIGVRGDRLGVDANPTIRDALDELSPNGSRHLGGVLSNFEVIMQAAIVFDEPVRAFGADWASAANRTGVRLTIGENFVELVKYLGDDGRGFFGMVSNEPFSRVVLSASGYEDYGVDNVRFAVPEPNFLGTVVTLGGAILTRRNRHARR